MRPGREHRRGVALLVRLVVSMVVLLVSHAGAATAATDPPAFGPPVVVSTDPARVDREPALALAPDGWIYINALNQGFAFDGPVLRAERYASALFRSPDGGVTWHEPPRGLRGELPGGGNSAVTVDPRSGSLYIADLWDAETTVSRSRDHGSTWRTSPVQGIPVQHRPEIAAASSGWVYYVTHNYAAGLIFARSRGGMLWTGRKIVASPADQEGCLCAGGNIIAAGGPDPSGRRDRVGMIYAAGNARGAIRFARSEDGGRSFTTVEIQPTSRGSTIVDLPVVADAGGDRLAAVWTEQTPGRSAVVLAVSSDWGKRWKVRQPVVEQGTSFAPWVDAAGGKIAITAYHTDVENALDAEGSEALWYQSYAESTDAGATFSRLAPVDATPALIGSQCTQAFACYLPSAGYAPDPRVDPEHLLDTSLCDALAPGCVAHRELGNRQTVRLDDHGRAAVAWTRSIDSLHTELRFTRQRPR